MLRAVGFHRIALEESRISCPRNVSTNFLDPRALFLFSPLPAVEHAPAAWEEGGAGMAVVLNKVSQLHAACGAGDVETVQAYVSNQRSEFVGGKRVMIFHLDPEGASPIALAAMGGHNAVVELLLRHKVPSKSKADVNGQSLVGSSPLMLAAQHGHLDTVTLLLKSSADVAALSKAGESALHYAARNRDGHSRSVIMETLTAAGADAGLQNSHGLTAADIAAGKDPTLKENAAPAVEDAPATPASAVKGAEKTIEQYVTLSDGRRVKQVLDLNRAEWNAMGQRIVPVASEHEDAREKRLREKEAKKAQKEAAREQEYIAATGDERGFQGFVLAGQREMTAVEIMAQQLTKLGFAADVALITAKASEGRSLEDTLELAQTIGRELEESNARKVEELERKKAERRAAQEARIQADKESAAITAKASEGAEMLKDFLFKDAAAAESAGEAAGDAGVTAGSNDLLAAFAEGRVPSGLQRPLPSPNMAGPPPGTMGPPLPGNMMGPSMGWMPGMLPPHMLPPHVLMQQFMMLQQQMAHQHMMQFGAPPPPEHVMSPTSGAEAGKQILNVLQGGEGAAPEAQGKTGQNDTETATGQTKKGFQTDTQISNVALKERELQAFDFGAMQGDVGGVQDLENPHFKPQKRKVCFERKRPRRNQSEEEAGN